MRDPIRFVNDVRAMRYIVNIIPTRFESKCAPMRGFRPDTRADSDSTSNPTRFVPFANSVRSCLACECPSTEDGHHPG